MHTQQNNSYCYQITLVSQQSPMSYFPIELRDIDKNNQHSTVGPGQYFAQPSKANKQAYAPFGSLSPKKHRAIMQHTLGPGQYTLNRDLVAPCINRYQNKNIVIVKINDDGGHQFKSRTNRFTETKTSAIGPGSQLDNTSLPSRKVKSTSINKPKIADKIRQINRKYYLEHRQVTLMSDPLKTQPTTDKKSQESPKARGVVSWSLNKKERFTIDIKEEYTPEEKERALSEIIMTRNKKVKPSAVFVSKTIKSHLEAQIYKTNNPFKAELRKMINFKDDQPGPGTYQIPASSSQQTPKKFQFFGSTVERFPENTHHDNVGPGSYLIPEKSRSLRQNHITFYDSEQKQDRHSYLPTNLQNPGPGSYNLDSLVHPSKSEKQFDKAFGSCQPRFRQAREDSQAENDANFQMTAYYKEKQARKEHQLEIRKAMLESHGSSAFLSVAKRFQHPKQQNVEIGSYELNHTDISTRLARYQHLAKQLQECQLRKPPFLSSQQRFKAEKMQQNGHKDCWCLVKSVQKQMLEHESPAFACGQRRDIFEVKSSAPPVGHYENASKGMIKDSFNSRFRKKAENQIKRTYAIKNSRGGNKVDGVMIYGTQTNK